MLYCPKCGSYEVCNADDEIYSWYCDECGHLWNE